MSYLNEIPVIANFISKSPWEIALWVCLFLLAINIAYSMHCLCREDDMPYTPEKLPWADPAKIEELDRKEKTRWHD